MVLERDSSVRRRHYRFREEQNRFRKGQNSYRDGHCCWDDIKGGAFNELWGVIGEVTGVGEEESCIVWFTFLLEWIFIEEMN